MVEAPRTRALASARLTLLADTTVTAPVKSLDALARVMLLAAPAVRLVVPGTTNAPLWVIPVAVTFRLPSSVRACRSSEVMSTTVTSWMLPAEARKLTLPPKLLPALSRVMEVALGTVKLEVPLTSRLPLSLRAPPALTVRVPLMVEAPRIQGVGIRQADVVAGSHRHGAEGVGRVGQGDVVGRPGAQGGESRDRQHPALGDGPGGSSPSGCR